MNSPCHKFSVATLITLLPAIAGLHAQPASPVARTPAPLGLLRLQDTTKAGQAPTLAASKFAIDDLSPAGVVGAGKSRKDDVDVLALDAGKVWSRPLRGSPRDVSFVSFLLYASASTIVDLAGVRFGITTIQRVQTLGFGVTKAPGPVDPTRVMARKLRLESEGGIYHVISRGNYRAPVFRGDKTKAAFLHCLNEACGKTGWRIQAWCLRSNHYHLAVETPRANLVEGMRWLQGTFSIRFNRLRQERGHVFQGRYKSLLVDPDGGLGSLCHYIHLNPVRAHLRRVEQLPEWPWSSLHWLMAAKLRPAWYDPSAALAHAGGLRDTAAGRKKYLDYLAWLAEDDPARKAQNFSEMSKGWIIGTVGFAMDMAREHAEAAGHGRRLASDMRIAQEAVWAEELARLLSKLGRPVGDLKKEGKSVPWKLALAAGLKSRTTATNRWLNEAAARRRGTGASERA